MIPHTQAFKRLKDEVQAAFDFAIVVCYAVPSLKAALEGIDQTDPLPFEPEHFNDRPIPTDKVRGHLSEYKEVLSRHLVLSSFSYFEAYFVDLIVEIIDFHGKDNLVGRHSLSRNDGLIDPKLRKSMSKLREFPLDRNRDAYRSHGARLAAQGFVFPSDALARYGLLSLIELAESDRIRSVDIPHLVESLLQLPLTEDEKEQFHAHRQLRNTIAHGRPKPGALYLKKAIEANNFLRNLALRIDRHVVENLMLVEL